MNSENNVVDNNSSIQIPKSNNKKSKNLSVISAKENYNLRAAMIHVIGNKISLF